MKLLVGRGVVFQQLTWLELASVLLSEAVHEINVLSDADLVEVTEGPTAERRKTDTKDQTNITNDRISDDFIFQALGSFVNETSVEKRKWVSNK